MGGRVFDMRAIYVAVAWCLLGCGGSVEEVGAGSSGGSGGGGGDSGSPMTCWPADMTPSAVECAGEADVIQCAKGAEPPELFLAPLQPDATVTTLCTALLCESNDPCVERSVLFKKGEKCTDFMKEDGASCGEGHQCFNGVCKCQDDNPCTVDTELEGGACGVVNKPDGTECDICIDMAGCTVCIDAACANGTCEVNTDKMPECDPS